MGDFGERGCRKYYGYLENIIGEMILVPLFPSLFSEFGERGCRKYDGYLERIIGEDILDRDI